jgi:hypothetical protein
MSAATEDAMAELHGELAKVMKARLANPEAVSSADMSVIRQFLKDNGINADGTKDPAMRDLADDLPDHFDD